MKKLLVMMIACAVLMPFAGMAQEVYKCNDHGSTAGPHQGSETAREVKAVPEARSTRYR